MKDTLQKFPARLHRLTRTFYREVPSMVASRNFIDGLINLLFPLRDNKDIPEEEVARQWEELQGQFLAIISPLCANSDCCSGELTQRFFEEVPLIYAGLMQDAEHFAACDPAAYSKEEIILCYPGYYAIAVHRFAHEMYRLGIPILPRVISEWAHSRTGIDIHPGATIGKRFYIDHGTGIVIGETAEIGDNVTIYQGVTLGATYVDKGLTGMRRHPKIEDNVILYAGSTILGGNTVIGHDTVVGGNVWLTESVPPYSKVYHRPEIVIREGSGKA